MVQNPQDPEAQWSCKYLAKTKTWVAIKTQFVETVSESDKAKKKGDPTEQFITVCSSNDNWKSSTILHNVYPKTGEL